MTAPRYLLLISGLVMLSAATAGLCADEAIDKAKPTPSLDQQLLDNLDNALLEGLDDQPTKKSSAVEPSKSQPDAQSSGQKTTRSDGDAQLDLELLRELDGEDLGSGEARQDPLVGIGRRMRSVESRLIDQKLDDQTRQMQKRILDDLALLLQECKKCQGGDAKPGSKAGKGSQSGNGPAGQAPSDTARDSSEKLKNRKTQRGDSGALNSAMKQSWGNLPQHVRKHFSNVKTDAFLPKYELMLEKYFKRLGEANAGER